MLNTYLVNGVGAVMMTRQNLQESFIGFRITALFDFLHVLHGRLNGVAIPCETAQILGSGWVERTSVRIAY
jgi:hypothetical protein